MSQDREPPEGPSPFVTDLGARSQFTTVTTTRQMIRIDMEIPTTGYPEYFVKNLAATLSLRIPGSDGDPRKGPFWVAESPEGSNHVLVSYHYRPGRDVLADGQALLRVAADLDIPVTDEVTSGIAHAFGLLQERNAAEQGPIVAEQIARRGAKKEPGGRGSR